MNGVTGPDGVGPEMLGAHLAHGLGEDLDDLLVGHGHHTLPVDLNDPVAHTNAAPLRDPAAHEAADLKRGEENVLLLGRFYFSRKATDPSCGVLGKGTLVVIQPSPLPESFNEKDFLICVSRIACKYATWLACSSSLGFTHDAVFHAEPQRIFCIGPPDNRGGDGRAVDHAEGHLGLGFQILYRTTRAQEQYVATSYKEAVTSSSPFPLL